jgi:hypothetical protein
MVFADTAYQMSAKAALVPQYFCGLPGNAVMQERHDSIRKGRATPLVGTGGALLRQLR